MRGLAFLLAVGATAPVAAQTTWYVDANATPPGAGTPASPYASIQHAIAQPTTVSGDTVLVLPGTYVEQLDFLGKAITVVSQAGAATTIVDGNAAGSVVRFASGEGPGSVLDGFTIRNGVGSGAYPYRKGGGIHCSGASPTLARLVITGNEADQGAGIYLESSTSSISLCTIRNSVFSLPVSTGYDGGGIYATCNSSPLVSNCTISSHPGGSHGGGIYGAGTYVDCVIEDCRAANGGGAFSGGCNLHLVGCTISGNFSVAITGECFPGGGVWGPALLESCTVEQNYACAFGGGVYQATLRDCTVDSNTVRDYGPYPGLGGGAANSVLIRCEVSRNRAGASSSSSSAPYGIGGGAYQSSLTDCDVHENLAEGPSPATHPARGGGLAACSARRCTIRRNRAVQGGGAIDGTLTNCTLFENVATAFGGGVLAYSGTTTVLNSILWHDTSPEIAVSGGSIAVSYSDVEGGFAGTGNISADPLFWMPVAPDLHLKPGSPCIDAGDPASPLDPDGTRADMGAFPFAAAYCGTPAAYCLPKINSLGCAPSILFHDTPSVSGPDNFFLSCIDALNQKTGLLFWGRAAAPPPFSGGIVCVAGPLVRTAAQGSGGSAFPANDCSGTYTFFFSQAYMATHAVVASDTIYAQWFARDPAHPDGTGRSLSDALEFTVCP